MPGRARSASLPIAVALVVALMPAAPALAQSAGDEQYEDPFAGEDQSQSDGGGSAEPAAPAAAPDAEPQPSSGAPESTPATPAEEPQLPYTGADAGAVLLAGTILLAGGVALRVRLRERS